MDNIIAKVIRIDLDLYFLNIMATDELVVAKLRGNVKKKGSILVGDIVKAEKVNEDYMITEVINRRNALIRPPVANIDQMIIVVSAGEPTPDYILLDKQIVLCQTMNIEPIICVNKIDLQIENEDVKKDINYIKKIYSKLGIKVVFVSAEEDIGIEQLTPLLYGKTSAFSGNSGVGKSSITRRITDVAKQDIEVGEIGKKSKRGKHTTKSVRLYSLRDNTYILDTPGFSSYELYDLEYRKLRDYYPEFYKCHCDYDDCNHVIEDESVCDVKRHLAAKKIDQGRYDRYVYIFNKLKEQYDRRYK